MTLDDVRQRLAGSSGPRYWRSLEELARDARFEALVNREFPQTMPQFSTALDRRRFLAILGASLALGGMTGCTEPPREEIVPYVREQERIVPGKALYFATSMTMGGFATGLLVESRMGRPIKIEGNPSHPASLGATDRFSQAAILSLYDPDRAAAVMRYGETRTWTDAFEALRRALEAERPSSGAGVRLLTETISSPTLAQQIELFLKEFPEARWHSYEPVSRYNVYAGTEAAFGRPLDIVLDLDQADVIVSLDADFLASGPASVRYAHDFAQRRRVWPAEPSAAKMNRLYAVGPGSTLTATAADHFWPMWSSAVKRFAIELAQRLGVSAIAESEPSGVVPDSWLNPLANDLTSRRGRSLFVAGIEQPPAVHALACAMNDALGNTGNTVRYIQPVPVRAANGKNALDELLADMREGRVRVLVILGCNPAFTAPADLNFELALQKLTSQQNSFTAHLGQYRDETARACQWHLPEAHFLESWGDARAYDGTASLVQPLIAPLYGGRSAAELVAVMRGQKQISSRELVRTFWRGHWREESSDGPFEQFWEQSLHAGLVEGTAFAAEEVSLRDEWSKRGFSEQPIAASAELEIVFRPDPTIYDGRFANNAWLQELPKPLSHVTWDNVAVVGAETAERLGVGMEIGPHGGDMITDLVELRYGGRTVEAPIWVQPGHAEGSVTVYFGYGRAAAGAIGSGIGFNAYRIRTADHLWFDRGLQITPTGRRYSLASTQLHHLMHNRDLVRSATLDEYRTRPEAIAQPASSGLRPSTAADQLAIVDAHAAGNAAASAPSLYPEWKYPGYKWGMVIDQSACIGCNACVVACQVENNIPVVGKEEVARGREMHWLRIDTYYRLNHEAPEQAVEVNGDVGRNQAIARPTTLQTYFQPVPCMHCEKAPCEVVCPVNATVHSDEGLNDMVYNRCIGTRYCSNNCPYKVRRFNYFQYADFDSEPQKLLYNPDVTVRSRGVMEKCTYCVQRISAARIHADKDDRPRVKNREGHWIKPIYDNELLTACQAACPTQAIAFGDLNDAQSQVAKMRYDEPLNYGLLAELGTKPRTTYLAAIRNPNSEIL